jgi:tRNA pseudouridine55 synthase
MHGILLIDKPEGISSGDTVKIVKRLVKPAKVGHSGTLDPAASGLMVILIGAGTRSLDYLQETPKKYRMLILFGEETDSCDREGTVISRADPSGVALEDIRELIPSFTGIIDQIPPHFSALKRDGVPLYKLARKGEFPELAPRKVEIFSLELKGWAPPLADLELTCSKGTYARSLARDIGRTLNVGGRLEKLRRIASGVFRIDDAAPLDAVLQGGAEEIRRRLIPLDEALAHIPTFQALPSETRKLMQGLKIPVIKSRLPETASTGGGPIIYKIASGGGSLVILVSPEPQGVDAALRPIKVFKMLEEE